MGQDDTRDLIHGAEKLLAKKNQDKSADSLVAEADALVGSKKRDDESPSTRSLIRDAEKLARREPEKKSNVPVVVGVLIAVIAALVTWILIR